MFRLVGRHRIMGAIRIPKEKRITLVMTVLKAEMFSSRPHCRNRESHEEEGGRAMI
jgi:hypothetical protein